jgi:N-acetylglutamate synthase-like GNAT family acetyltransferase
MPNPIPALLIGRLAVDTDWQGHGIGKGMLRDAVIKAAEAAELAGLQALFVHAISEDAKKFYTECGFTSSPIDEMTLMISLKDAQLALQS